MPRNSTAFKSRHVANCDGRALAPVDTRGGLVYNARAMRLWSLHPKYLDARGLVALWREGLLAQEVLRGRTRGYVHHPQLERFRDRPSPVGAIAEYLRAVHAESVARGYRFAARKIDRARDSSAIAVTRGQLQLEWEHLMAKLATRDPVRRMTLARVKRPSSHPLFQAVPGESASWERARPRVSALATNAKRLKLPIAGQRSLPRDESS